MGLDYLIIPQKSNQAKSLATADNCGAVPLIATYGHSFTGRKFFKVAYFHPQVLVPSAGRWLSARISRCFFIVGAELPIGGLLHVAAPYPQYTTVKRSVSTSPRAGRSPRSERSERPKGYKGLVNFWSSDLTNGCPNLPITGVEVLVNFLKFGQLFCPK